jgi:hypothetical protein
MGETFKTLKRFVTGRAGSITFEARKRILRAGIIFVLTTAVVTPFAVNVQTTSAHASEPDQDWNGFDDCALVPQSVMDSQWAPSTSGLTDVGFYLSSDNQVYEGCTVPSLTYLSSIKAYGWDIMPIFIGAQAPAACGGSSSGSPELLSTNTNTDASMGVTDAEGAAADASAEADISPSSNRPIAVDMENYNTTATDGGVSCESMVSAYLEYFVAELAAYPYGTMIYASSSENMSTYINFDVVPFEIWPAQTAGGDTTLNIEDLANYSWGESQRMKQWALRTDLTYNGVEENVDVDCANATVDGTTSYATSDPSGTC